MRVGSCLRHDFSAVKDDRQTGQQASQRLHQQRAIAVRKIAVEQRQVGAQRRRRTLGFIAGGGLDDPVAEFLEVPAEHLPQCHIVFGNQ